MLSIVLACLWAIAANVLAMMPSRRNHWPLAYVLMATGAPLLVLMWVQNGPWGVLILTLAAASILRWPLRYALRRAGLAR
ncbi:uncharacterized protein DUF2484 [Brevirhabdus pacifica]|nr:uncharacterized protein DUF2484 [Brevirhabdus pacifica]